MRKSDLKRAQQAYCIAVQSRVEAAGGHPGKINWDGVKCCFFSHIGPDDAAKAVIKEQREESWWKDWRTMKA